MNNNNKLQSLRIPVGWCVQQNIFCDIDPEELDENDEKWRSFNQDLMQICFERKNITLDLGWYPEENPEGTYQISLIRDEEWEDPIEFYATRNKQELVDKIEDLLMKVAEGKVE